MLKLACGRHISVNLVEVCCYNPDFLSRGKKQEHKNQGLQPKLLLCFGLKFRILSEFVFSGMNAGVINKNSSLS